MYNKVIYGTVVLFWMHLKGLSLEEWPVESVGDIGMQLPLFEGTMPGQANPRPKRKQAGRLVSYSSARNQWQTPQNIVDHALSALGAIDLDPCSNANFENSVPARLQFTPEDNSLSRRWIGRVWLNPPYGRAIGSWIEKLTHEYESGDVTSAERWSRLAPIRSGGKPSLPIRIVRCMDG